MKALLSAVIILLGTASSGLAQEFTLTTVREAIVASKVAITLQGLDGNAAAIIVAKPIGDTQSRNPHPIGAWYYNNKWNLFNTDHATMLEGLSFDMQVFPQPGALQFLHVMTQDSFRGERGKSYIDNRALNNNPTARFAIFQNYAPDYRASYLNRFEAMAEYDAAAAKWYIRNVNREPLYPNTAYNIAIAFAGTVGAPPPLPVGPPPGGAAPPPGASAPLVVVAREVFTLGVDQNPLSPGQCRVKSYYNPNVLMTDTAIVTAQRGGGGDPRGDYLQWTVGSGDGSLLILVCNGGPPLLSNNALPPVMLSNLKVNILVLR